MSWTNNNVCFSFTESLGTTMKALCTNQDCSEVFIYNLTSGPLVIYDNNNTNYLNSFTIPSSAFWTIRGITNSAQVSAVATIPGLVSYRTQKFSDMSLFNY